MQNMSTGAVRLCYAAVYAMSMGLGIAIGTSLYTVIDTSVEDVIVDYMCSSVHHVDGPWWQRPVPDGYGMMFFLFFLVRI